MLIRIFCMILTAASVCSVSVCSDSRSDIVKNITDSVLNSVEDSSNFSPLLLQLGDKRQQKEFLRKFKENPRELYTTLDFAKVALQLTAAGENAKSYIDEVATSPSLRSAEEAAWALIAVNSADYDLPKDAVWNREKLVSYMLACQLEDGGFGSASGQFDVDTTAAVISALAPFQGSNDGAAQAVSRAVQRLAEAQLDSGGFTSHGVLSQNSLASVITALSKIGIDANTDQRFIKDGNGLVDLLLRNKNAEGSATFDGNTAEALAAYELFKSDKGIYEFKKPNIFQKLFSGFTVVKNSKGEPKKSFIQKIVEFVFKIKPKSRVSEDYSNAASEGIGFASVSLTVGETVIFQSSQFQVNKGDTAFSVFVRATALNGMSAVWEGDFPDVYVTGAGNFSNNDGKSWRFLINGQTFSDNSTAHNVSNGDRLEWSFK